MKGQWLHLDIKTVPTDVQKKKKNPKESLHNLPKITFQKSGTLLSNKSPAFSVRAHLTLKSTYFIQLTGILLIN